MQTGASHSMSMLLQGADLTGICLLAALLAIGAWTCLRPQPLQRGAGPAAAGTPGIYLLLCAMVAPLLMFAALGFGLGLLQTTQPQLLASAQWHPYRSMLWMLFGVVGLQQLFALQRLGFWPAPQSRRLAPLASTALVLLPLAMASGLLALGRTVLPYDGLPPAVVAAAALASASGILLWLPARMHGVAACRRRAAPSRRWQARRLRACRRRTACRQPAASSPPQQRAGNGTSSR